MTELERKAVEESIAHWERMINWAKTQPPEDKKSTNVMWDNIKEHWYADYCALCKLVWDKQSEHTQCEKCVLATIAGEFCERPNSIWRKVSLSTTWKEWLEHAQSMLSKLESLLQGAKK